MVWSNGYLPNKNELKDAPPRVLYELKMFHASVHKCQSVDVDTNPALYNISLEATLLHARNLLDFFCGNETRKDDIRAAHFISKNKLPAGDNWWKSNKLGYLNSRRDDLNYSISHLTYRRVSGKPSWNVETISKEIKEAFDEFLSYLPNNEQVVWRLTNS
jgi:hypothetical protein